MDEDRQKTGSLSKVLDNISLSCHVCKETLNNPQVLSCLENVCQNCLTDGSNCCPLCQKSIDREKIKDNYFLTSLIGLVRLHEGKEDQVCDYCAFEKRDITATVRCLDCTDNLCDDCSAAHSRTKLTRGHTMLSFKEMSTGKYDQLIRERETIQCEIHAEQTAVKYCSTCDQLLCRECLDNTNSAHDRHQIGSVEEHGHTAKDSLSTASDQTKVKLQKMEEYSNVLQDYMRNLNEQGQLAAQAIQEQADALHTLVDNYKSNVLKQLEDATTKESNDLETKMKKLETLRENMHRSLDFTDALVTYGRLDEIVSLHKVMKERFNELLMQQLQGVSGRLNIGFISGSTPERTINLVFGKLSVSHQPGTSNPGVTNATVQPVHEALSAFQPISNTQYHYNNNKNAMTNGTEKLDLLSRAELLLEFEANSPLDTRDIWPTGIAVSSMREFYILDRDNKAVKVYDANGRYKFEFGGPGSGEGSLASPYDLTIVDDSLVLITDYQHEMIKTYSLSGKFRSAYKGPFRHPRGITAVSNRRFAVVDCRTRQLTLHEADTGLLLNTFKDQTLTDPYYVCATPDDLLVVTDWASPSLKVVDLEGRLLANTGSYGSGSEQLLQPYGVLVDHGGNILVADNSNHRVHLLSKDSRFQRFVLTKFDNLWHPMALATTPEGNLVVTEALGKVKVFRYYQNSS